MHTVVYLGVVQAQLRSATCFGSRSFAVAAPTTWNSVPLHIPNSSSIFGFRCQLKTFLYKLVFNPF